MSLFLNEAMKPGVSSLNPYAASYIPLSKREAYDRTEPTTKDFKSSSENVWYAHPGHVTQNYGKVSYDSRAQGAQKFPIPEGSTVKSHPLYGPYGSSSKQMMDEEFEIDLEYLQMSFPGLSNQSLTDVYLANNHDLEATVDMLNQLEVSFDDV